MRGLSGEVVVGVFECQDGFWEVVGFERVASLPGSCGVFGAAVECDVVGA